MNRLCALLCLLTLGPLACERATSTRSNVVLIVIDTQRAQNLSLYGYHRETSPELERFAREAITFETAMKCQLIHMMLSVGVRWL